MTSGKLALWLVFLVWFATILVLATGCSDRERDPLAAYHVDPKAFQFWVVPF